MRRKFDLMDVFIISDKKLWLKYINYYFIDPENLKSALKHFVSCSLLIIEFFHNSRLMRWILQNKIYKNSESWPGIEPRSLAYLSATLIFTLEYFLCFCDAEIESYSCMSGSAQFV